MAGADYRNCDVCHRKAFYDARLNYEYVYDGDEASGVPPRRCGRDDYGFTLDYLGDWAVLCDECRDTHCTAIVCEQRALDAWHGVRAEGGA